ncbi:hypothetical protein MPSEU_000002400 [Mayamaea pseudoterrestris]|nr:hypothetical protein MPSEU_000002400 [Mayamaea pseudoterrestris]
MKVFASVFISIVTCFCSIHQDQVVAHKHDKSKTSNEHSHSEGSNDNDDSITLEDFSHPHHEWREMNDPVMGGKSTGTFQVKEWSGTAVFEGSVEHVWFLRAPGFIQARVVEDFSKPFPDVSSCQAIQLTLRTNNETAAYNGFRFSFGNAHAPGGKHFAYGYKTTLCNVPVGDFGDLILPFDSFTDFWDDATGDPIHTCQEDSRYCPDNDALENMGTMAIWAEGVAGKVWLELKSIKAVNCTSATGVARKSDDATTKRRGNKATSALLSSEGQANLLRGWSTQSAAPLRLFGGILVWMFGGE